jgi:hypothetical protein
MTIPPSSPPTRPRPLAPPSSYSASIATATATSTSAAVAASPRRATAAAATTTATSSTEASGKAASIRSRSHKRGRRTGTGYSSARVKLKRRPKMGLGNLSTDGEQQERSLRGGSTTAMATFLSEISNTGLLSKEQEIQYTVEAQELMRLEAVREAVTQSMGRSVTLEEWAAAVHLPPKTLQARVHTGQTAKRLMVEHNVRLAVHVARRYVNKGVPMGDLVQEGLTGLVSARLASLSVRCQPPRRSHGTRPHQQTPRTARCALALPSRLSRSPLNSCSIFLHRPQAAPGSVLSHAHSHATEHVHTTAV